MKNPDLDLNEAQAAIPVTILTGFLGLRFRANLRGSENRLAVVDFPSLEIWSIAADALDRLGGKFGPTHAVGQVPGCCLKSFPKAISTTFNRFPFT